MTLREKKKRSDFNAVALSLVLVVTDLVRSFLIGRDGSFFYVLSYVFLFIITILFLLLSFYVYRSIKIIIKTKKDKRQPFQENLNPFEWNDIKEEPEKENVKNNFLFIKYIGAIILVGLVSHYLISTSMVMPSGDERVFGNLSSSGLRECIEQYSNKFFEGDKDSLILVISNSLTPESKIKVNFLSSTKDYTIDNFIFHLETCLLLEKVLLVDSIHVENQKLKYLEITEVLSRP